MKLFSNMKKRYFITTALSGLTLLSGSMLTSCSDEQTTEPTQTQNAEAAKAPSVATTKAVGPVVKTTTPEERAASFPALAYIPATANTYIAVNTEELTQTALKICPNWEMLLPQEAEMVKSAALAFSEGNERVITTLLSAATAMAAAQNGLMEQDIDPIALATDALQNFKPIYLSATLTDTTTAEGVIALITMGQAQLQQGAPFLVFGENNGWNCISCKLADIPQGEFPFDTALLGDTTLTVAYRQIENAIVVAICNNPAELTTPASAKESVLGTIAADSLNSLGGKPGLLTASATAALQNALVEFTVNSSFPLVTSSLVRLLPEDSAQQLNSAFGKLEQTIKSYPKVTKPMALTAWQDGDVHLALECDAYGSTFNTANTCGTAPQNTIYYAYGSGITNLPKVDYKGVIDAYVQIFAVLSGKAESVYKAYAAIENNLAPVHQLLNSLDSGWSFSLDAQANSTSPLDYEDEAAGSVTTTAPRLAFAAQLKDKAAFEQAVQATFGAIHNIAAELAPGAESVVDTMLTTEQSTVNNASVYTFPNVSKPQQGLVANYAVSGTAAALGSDTKLTTQMATATADTSATGWFCELNLAPIVAIMEAEMKAETARADYYTQKDPEDYLGSAMKSHAEFLANKVDNFRKVISMITGGKASLTTQDGKFIFHVQAHTPCLK